MEGAFQPSSREQAGGYQDTEKKEVVFMSEIPYSSEEELVMVHQELQNLLQNRLSAESAREKVQTS